MKICYGCREIMSNWNCEAVTACVIISAGVLLLVLSAGESIRPEEFHRRRGGGGRSENRTVHSPTAQSSTIIRRSRVSFLTSCLGSEVARLDLTEI